MKKDRKHSKFMEWGQKNEATLAHFVAWTLKCSTEEGAKEYGDKLRHYSNEILFFLLFGKNYKTEMNNCFVTSVEIWREWKRIDILAEITLTNNKKYALFIELKAYSHTSEQQLESYRKACGMYDYKNKGFEEKFVLLGAWNDEVPEIDKAYCNKFDFAAYTFGNILGEIFLKGGETFESSENILFDEFWTGYW